MGSCCIKLFNESTTGPVSLQWALGLAIMPTIVEALVQDVDNAHACTLACGSSGVAEKVNVPIRSISQPSNSDSCVHAPT